MDPQTPFTPEDIFESLKDIRRADPSPFLFTRIEARIDASNAVPDFQRKWIMRLALATLFIIGLNIATWVHFNKRATPGYEEGVSTVASAYSFDNDIYF